jgi:hypothetical protein
MSCKFRKKTKKNANWKDQNERAHRPCVAFFIILKFALCMAHIYDFASDAHKTVSSAIEAADPGVDLNMNVSLFVFSISVFFISTPYLASWLPKNTQGTHRTGPFAKKVK